MSRHKNQALASRWFGELTRTCLRFLSSFGTGAWLWVFVFISSVQAWRVNMSKIFALTELDALFGLP